MSQLRLNNGGCLFLLYPQAIDIVAPMSGTTTNESPSFSYSEFTPAKSRKKRKNKAEQERIASLELLQRAREELGQGNWLKQCQRPCLVIPTNYPRLTHYCIIPRALGKVPKQCCSHFP